MITVRVSNSLEVGPVDRLPDAVKEQIRARLTFINPQWEENERRGFSNWDTPRELCFLEHSSNALTLPRGFTKQLIGILRGAGVQFRAEDQRRILPEVDFQFQGELKDFQVEAVQDVLSRDTGTLAAPTGSGKTVMALYVVAQRRQPVMVVCHTKELQEQWISRIETFLGIPAREVGRIGGGKLKVGERITVGLVQSIYKCAGEIAPHIGHLIVDEAHHCPSRTFTECVTAFDCRYMLGLSATPWRRDRLTRLIYWYLGDRVHEVDKDALVGAGHILQAEVIWRETDFEPTYDPSEEYSRMLSELSQDRARNALIVDDVTQEAGNGAGISLILTDRKAHCETLVDLLEARGIEAHLLTGDLSARERQKVVEDLNGGKVRVLVGTGQLCGEGLDFPQLAILFLATPIKFDGRLLQHLGRVLRPAPGKTQAKVFDFVDVKVPVLMNAARARGRVYGLTDS